MQNSKSNSKLIFGTILLVALGSLGYFFVSGKNNISSSNSQVIASTINYKDGTYDVTGDYTSPAGPEEIEVKLTLKNNVVEDATVVSKATKPISIKMQESFISAFKPVVVGKSIDTLNLDKVGGASLTSKGFNDALEKIKNQARV